MSNSIQTTVKFRLPASRIAVKKAGRDWTFNPEWVDDSVADRVFTHIWEYGIRQILNDAAASAKTASEAAGLVQKRFDNLLAGTLRASPNREGDPVRAEAIRIATERVKTALKKKGHKLADVDAKHIRKLAEGLLDKDSTILLVAEENVNRAKEIDIDVDDILGDDFDAMLHGEADDEAEDETAPDESEEEAEADEVPEDA